MNRSPLLLVIVVALVGYGLYRALYIPGMLIAPPAPGLLVGFLLQAMFGIVAGVAVAVGAFWAPVLIVLLGVSVAATALIEGVLGLIPYLRMLLEAIVAIVLALVLAGYVKGELPTRP